MHVLSDKKVAVYLILLLLLLLWGRMVWAQEEDAGAPAETGGLALMLDVNGPIGPATRDFVTRSLDMASERGAKLVIIRMDTPGGLDASTRDIIKAILNCDVPVATWVAPGGARAASAGTYILLASHIAAMSPATNVGAATPVSIMGGTPAPEKKSSGHQGKGEGEEGADTEHEGEDETASAPSGDAMTHKVVNDAIAYIRGLAEKRGRNADWAEQAVRDADSITAERALELGVIDFIAANTAELLEQADGRVVDVNGIDETLHTSGLVIERVEPDWRSELLGVITSPTIAYMLLLIGVYGLVLEGYNPGAVLPGVVGAICLLMALYAFQMLPVNYAGLGLIVLGIILMIAEIMAPSFGALGFGGIISMVIGSIILMDTDVPGFQVSKALIGAIATAGSLGLMAIVWIAVRARQRPVVSGREQLIGAHGAALEDFDTEGEVFVHSERWTARSDRPVHRSEAVEVTGIEGLVLRVRPLTTTDGENNDV
ncbi:MAG: nodulation protein NfeD [Lysobacterales bacterium]